MEQHTDLRSESIYPDNLPGSANEKTQPVWGTLTGIRPTKVAEKLLLSGKNTDLVTETLIQTYYVTPDRAALCTEIAQSALTFKESICTRDIALYIGIPFCTTRCAYCSFVSNSVEKSFDLIDPFLNTLLQEIEEIAKLTDELGLRVICVYIGGGTPTALQLQALEVVLTALGRLFDFSGLREYTMEAGRPDTITEQKLEMSIRHGAKRICINPQSMSEKVLAAIGRDHSPNDIFKAVEMVRKTEATLNMDIIAGLPGDTLKSFKNTLDTVLSFKPENITVHTLSLKKGSRIMLENTMIPSGTDVGKMLDYAAYRLRESKYSPYYLYRQKYISGGFENTGWCIPDHEGVYNICMMEEFCTVLALGGGGVTKLVTPDGRIERIFNAKFPREYIMMTEKMKENIGRIRENAISI